jgi:aryl-alcohol dehydrogenase-like predicted oxidoreductase
MCAAAALPETRRVSVLDRATAVDPIGLGLAAPGRPAYINLGRDEHLREDRSRGNLERRAHAVLDAAWEAGVRYLDTARSYGLAGAFLASWLGARDRPANALVIGSKWGYPYTGQRLMTEPVQERKDLSPAAFRRHLHETQHLLGEHLHPYQIHSATIDSGVLDDDDLLAELAALRRSSGSVGVTVTGPGQADTIDRALEVGLLRHRAGDVEPARTLRRSGAAARSRRWIGRHREGGSRQRPADDPRRQA